MVNERPAHSPLGASGAYQWMICSGSVIASVGFDNESSLDALTGSAAHVIGDVCLTHKREPWQFVRSYVDAIDETIYSGDALDVHFDEEPSMIRVDVEMATAVQDYMNAIEEWHPDKHQGNSWIERKFYCPDIHEHFYGMSDFVYLDELHTTTSLSRGRTLHVWDYKHGVGIVVEATDNPQCKYYAAGILEDLQLWDAVDNIVIHIFQPRGWHKDGPHRTFEISTSDLVAWLEDTCVPAMDKALVSREVIAGEHCRFCPARQGQCPALMNVMVEFEELLKMALDDEKGVDALTDAQLGRLLDLQKLSGTIFKAAKDTAYKKLIKGEKVPGAKLVTATKHRIYKKGSELKAKREFGTKCMSKPELLSPAKLEALPGGKAFTARYAFKPDGGTTVAVEGDPRRRINRDKKSLFKPVEKGMKK